MDITFRTLGPWGPGKGANLQPSEVDSNFWSIAQAILDLQENPALPNGIASITVSGTQMTIYLNDGSVMGPFTLPVLVFRWRGEWEASTAYEALDVFTVFQTGIFMVQAAHLSGDTFDPDLAVGGAPAYLQLFGSTDASLDGLSDVTLTNLQAGDFLTFGGVDWINIALGSIAYQNADDVVITGGVITGMPVPVSPNDVATKGYVDSLPAGATAPPNTLMANISLVTQAATPQTFTDFLDAVLFTSIRGTMLYRGDTGWLALPPGTPGYFLRTAGAGADPAWAVGGSGVTSITAGTGLAGSPNPIVATGTLGLAAVADNSLLANASGGSAAPTPTTLTSFLDHVLGAGRGTVLTRTSGGWLALAPGPNGQYLKSQGSGADLMWDAPVGSGTVTSVASGAGLTGGPITGVGTLALAAIADLTLLANTSGGSAAPSATTLTLLFDRVFGTTQGAVLYRSNTGWVSLSPGTNGQVLTTAGGGASPSWQNAPVTGASVPTSRIIANISGATAVPTANTLSNILDVIVSSARGTLLYRSGAGWTGLAPGTSGFLLATGGTGGDPSWVAPTSQTLDSLTDVSMSGTGAPQALDTFVYNTVGTQWVRSRQKYNIACYVPGTMVANQNLLFHRLSAAITINAQWVGHLGHNSQAGGATLPTSPTTITFAKALNASPRSFTDFGSLTLGPTGITTWNPLAAQVTFLTGDVLRVRGPAVPDPTLSDFHMTLVAFETGDIAPP